MENNKLKEFIEQLRKNAEQNKKGTEKEPEINNLSVHKQSCKEYLYEDKESRTHNMKFYKVNSNSARAVITCMPQHYFSATDNKMRSIDNTLEFKERENSDDFEGYENKYNGYKVRFAKDTETDNLMRVVKDEYEILFKLIVRGDKYGKGLRDRVKRNARAVVSDTRKKRAIVSGIYENKEVNPNLESYLSYSGIFDGVDIDYEVKADRIKENITLNGRSDNYEFAFRIMSKGLKAQLDNDCKSVSFIPKNNKASAEPVFIIPAGYMYDKNGSSSYAISYCIEEINEGEYVLKIIPDSNWLNSGERVYPVVIDPTILIKSTNDVFYQLVSNYSGYSSGSGFYRVENNCKQLGFFNGNAASSSDAASLFGETYLYIGIKNTTQLLKGNIRKASLQLPIYLNPYVNNANGYFNLYGITASSSWMNSSIDWSSKPVNGVDVLGCATPKFHLKDEDADEDNSIKLYYIDFDITSALKSEYSGFVIKANESNIAFNGYWRNSIYVPNEINGENVVIAIDYAEPGQTVGGKSIGQSCNRSGNGSIDLFTGDLVFAHNDLNLEGLQFPINISHVYKSINYSSYPNSIFSCGAGWSLNIFQTLIKKSAAAGSFYGDSDYKSYEYTDATGNKHEISTRYYKEVNDKKVYCSYKENAGLKSEISNGVYTLSSESNYNVLTDDAGNKLRFETGYGLLVAIEKPETASVPALKMKIEYVCNSQTEIYVTVTDSNGKSVVLNFAGGMLNDITYNNKVICSFTYKIIGVRQYLEKIYYGTASSKNYTTFGYESSKGYLNKITDPAGYILEYSGTCDTKPKMTGYSIKTVTDKIAYSSDENAGVSTGTTRTAEEVSITYNARTPDGKLYCSQKMDNLTIVQNKVGAKVYYFFNSDGTPILTWDDKGNTEATNINISSTDEDDIISTTSKITTATVLGSAGSYDWDGDNGLNVLTSNIISQAQTVSIQSYTGLSSGWYVFTAAVSGCIAMGSDFASLEVADTPYAVIKVTKTSYNGSKEVEFARLDPKVSGSGKGQIVALPFYVDNTKVSSVGLSFESKANPNTIVIESWNLMQAASATEIEAKDKEPVTTITYKGGYTTKTVSDVEKSGNIRKSVATRIGASSITSTVTYDDTYPERVIKQYDGISLEKSYLYDSYGNVTQEKICDKISDKTMMKSYAYTNMGDAIKDIAGETGYGISAEYYSDTGYLKSVTLPGTRQKISYTYTGNDGRLSSVKALDNSTYFVNETANNFQYNKGYITKLTHDGCEYLYEYDGFGRVTSVSAGGKTVIKSAYTDSGTNIDGVEGATSKTVTVYYSDDVMNMPYCGSLFCGQMHVFSFSRGENNAYASYYNKFGELIKIRHVCNADLTYSFTSANDYITITDTSDGVKRTVKYVTESLTYEYVYDAVTGELLNSTEYDTTYGDSLLKIKFEVEGKDSFGRITSEKYSTDSAGEQSYYYTYKSDYEDTVKSITLPNSKVSTIETDAFGRITSKTIDTSSQIFDEYTYKADGSNTTPLVAQIEQKIGGNSTQLRYTYDSNGNITTVRNGNNSLIASYEYDGLNRLVRENIPNGNITIYSYNSGGNITEKRIFAYSSYSIYSTSSLMSSAAGKPVIYSYSSTVKDRLINYNGSGGLSYDNYGNPKKWFKHGVSSSVLKYTLQWRNATELASVTDDDTRALYRYSYNDQGIRIKKIIGRTTHRYYLQGERIIAETRTSGMTTNVLKYYYDSTGLCAFDYNGTVYYYQKNLQGDIIKIYDGSGTFFAEYGYDAWGKCTIKSDVNNIATLNPFRYRGYYLDNETNLYYLNSRYYDPEIGRFISPDSLDYLDPENINGLNLYAYCANNPVMCYDPSGHSVTLATFIIVGLIIGAIAGGVAVGVVAYNNGVRGWALVGNITLGVVFGALVGAAVGTFIGIIAPVIGGGGGISGGAYALSKAGARAIGAAVAAGAAVYAGGIVLENGSYVIGNIVFAQNGMPRGVGGKGFEGDSVWRNDVKTVGKGGTIESLDGGRVPTEEEARRLIDKAGGEYLRTDFAHNPPNPHQFKHINYIINKIKATIKIL